MRSNENTNFTIRDADQTKRNKMLRRNKTISSNNPGCLYNITKRKLVYRLRPPFFFPQWYHFNSGRVEYGS